MDIVSQLQQTPFGSLILLRHPPYSSFQKNIAGVVCEEENLEKKTKKIEWSFKNERLLMIVINILQSFNIIY